MVKKADIPKEIIETALRLAAETGWRDLSLAAIAAAAKLPLTKVYPVYSSKQAILNAFARRIDAEVLAAAELEAGEDRARDRLFDLLMRRFDALGPYRKALGNIVYDQARDPLAAGCALAQLRRTLALTLEAAGLSAGGLRGALRIKGLGLVYLATLRVWLRDESDDLARTMATLDRQLGRVERAVRCCSRAQPSS